MNEVATPEKLTSEEDFQAWMESKQEDISIAQKPEGERSTEEQAQYDMFVDEIRQVIPGADQLTPEQIRSLANNLEMTNTRHAGTQIRSLSDAGQYITDAMQSAQIEGGQNVSEGQLGEMAPPAVGTGQGRDKGGVGGLQ